MARVTQCVSTRAGPAGLWSGVGTRQRLRVPTCRLSTLAALQHPLIVRPGRAATFTGFHSRLNRNKAVAKRNQK
eukprot:2179836-Prymnesium_polylepis.2